MIVFWQLSILTLGVNEQPGQLYRTTTEILFIKLYIKIINSDGNKRSK